MGEPRWDTCPSAATPVSLWLQHATTHGGNLMVHPGSLLVTLVRLVDRLPTPTPPMRRGRGRPQIYPERLFLKALVIMILRHLHKVHELLAVLEQPTAEMEALRVALTVDARFPARRTFERRLKAL